MAWGDQTEEIQPRKELLRRGHGEDRAVRTQQAVCKRFENIMRGYRVSVDEKIYFPFKIF